MSQPLTPESKSDIRGKLLSARSRETRIVKFNGVEIELKQQSLQKILGVANNDKLTPLDRSILSFIDHAYYVGTDERIFDATDVDVIKSLPFGRDWMDVQKAINDLSGFGEEVVAEAEKEIATNP